MPGRFSLDKVTIGELIARPDLQPDRATFDCCPGDPRAVLVSTLSTCLPNSNSLCTSTPPFCSWLRSVARWTTEATKLPPRLDVSLLLYVSGVPALVTAQFASNSQRTTVRLSARSANHNQNIGEGTSPVVMLHLFIRREDV